MVNEPSADMLTLGDLRRLLADAPDETVLALKVPRGGLGDTTLSVLYNLRVDYNGDPVATVVPVIEA